MTGRNQEITPRRNSIIEDKIVDQRIPMRFTAWRCTFGFDFKDRNEDHQDLSWRSAYPVAE